MSLPVLEDMNVITSGWHPGLVVFPACRLVDMIAKGGFGEVWRADWGPLGPIALKKIAVKDPVRNESRALRLLAGIRHDHLAAIYGFRREGEVIVVAMELGDESLEDRFEHRREQGYRGLDHEELLTYFRQIAAALDYLYHERRVIHRDVKPGNLLRVGSVAKVCDYGLAKVLERSEDQHSGVASYDYAPPEYFEGKATASSDQFSLAVSYVYLLTGRRPFPGPSVRQLMMQHLTGKPDLEGLPEREIPAVQRALHRNPEERFESCSAFVRALTDE
jgi:serine/threonine protein kinase